MRRTTARQQPCGMGLGGDYNGLDFDMEDLLYTQSGLPGSLDGAIDWLTQVRQYAQDNGKGKVHAMLTILGNPYNSAENFAVKVETVKQYIEHFDYVALMLYGGSMGACGGA